MNELAAEYKKRIANSDGNSEVNDKEKTAISYVEKWAWNMPPDYLNKLIGAIEKKLADKQVKIEQVGVECEKAIKALNKTLRIEKDWEEWYAAKAIRYASNKYSERDTKNKLWLSSDDNLETKGFSNKWVHGYSKERWNYAATISEFEQTLKTKNVRDINSRALGNYFLSLNSKGQLTPEVLVSKFGSNTLFQLGQLWNAGWNPHEENSLLAKDILEKNGMGGILRVINTFISPDNFLEKIEKLGGEREQEIAILFLEKNLNSIQDTLRKDLRARFMKSNPKKAPEANAIIEKMMGELLVHTNLKGLPKVYEVFKKYNTEYKLELNIQKETEKLKQVQEVKNKVDLAKNKLAQTKNRDPMKNKVLQKERALLVRNGKDIEISAKANVLMKKEQIDALASGEKQIEQVIAELRTEHKGFDTYYRAWEKEKAFDAVKKWGSEEKIGTSSKDIEESWQEATKSSVTIRGLSRESLASMTIGSEKVIPLSDKNTANIRKITGNQYTVKIGEHDEMRLLGSQIRGYIWSYKLLQNTGLESMINMEPNKLSQVIASCSKDGNKIDNTDGSFWKDERMHFLKAMATACWVGESIAHDYNINTVRSKFTQALTLKGGGSPKEWFRLLAQESNFMTKESPYSIIPDTLIQKIKQQA